MQAQKSRPAATGQPTKGTTNSVPAGLANVKNSLRRLRLMTGLPSSTLIRTVREIYPGYDKSLQSKCERTEEYGVELCEAGMEALILTHAPHLHKTPPKPENRRRPCRVSCRLAPAEFEQLQLLISAKGFGTVQEYLHQLIIRQIRRMKK